MLPRRSLLALAVVVDVALHARGRPVAAKSLANRLGLAPRHLEPLLQDLVRSAILKGTRGPNGGYELARERRRISAEDIIRAIEPPVEPGRSGVDGERLLATVIVPMIGDAVDAFLKTLAGVTIQDLCDRAKRGRVAGAATPDTEFHI